MVDGVGGANMIMNDEARIMRHEGWRQRTSGLLGMAGISKQFRIHQ